MYIQGHGVTRNYQEARRLYALAPGQEHALATKYLKRLEETIHVECPLLCLELTEALLGNQVVVIRTGRRDLNGKPGVAAAASFGHTRGRYVVMLG